MPTHRNLSSCSFCSRNDSVVQVVCESNCLLCAKCQSTSTIRQLILNFANSSVYDKENVTASMAGRQIPSPGCCPICKSQMSRGMYLIILDFIDIMRETNMPNLFTKLTVQPVESYFVEFLTCFRSTYGEVGSDIKFGSIESSSTTGTIINNLGNANCNIESTSSLQIPSSTGQHSSTNNTKSGKIPRNRSQDIFSLGGRNTERKKVDINMSESEALFLISECFCGNWQSLSKERNDSIVEPLRRLCSKKKSSQRMNDYRCKGLLDVISSPSGRRNPICVLFGKLIGMFPEPLTSIRPAMGSIATAILVLCYCWDTCHKSKTMALMDSDGNPSHQELRTKIQKFSFDKIISLKQALSIVDLLIRSKQPHFVLAPLTSSCLELNSKLPWESDSINRLIHLIFYVVLGDRGAKVIKEREIRTSDSRPPSIAGSINNNSTNHSIQSNQSDQSFLSAHTAQSFPKGRANTPHTKTRGISISINDAVDGGKTIFPTEVLLPPEPSSHSPIPIPSPPSPLHPGSFINYPTSLDRISNLSAKAAEFWRASPSISQHPDHKMYRYAPDFSNLGKIQYPIITATSASKGDNNNTVHGSVSGIHIDVEAEGGEGNSQCHQNRVSGVFSPLNIASSISVSEDLTISFSELSLACIAAWEAECDLINSHIEHAKISTKRRYAMKGTFNSRASILSSDERNALIRVMKYYGNSISMGLGIDWSEFKVKVENRELPFQVPSHLSSRTPLELQYHYELLSAELYQRDQRERLEDALMSIERGIKLSDKEIKEIDNLPLTANRYVELAAIETYLASQKIGGAGDITPDILVIGNDGDEDGDNPDSIVQMKEQKRTFESLRKLYLASEIPVPATIHEFLQQKQQETSINRPITSRELMTYRHKTPLDGQVIFPKMSKSFLGRTASPLLGISGYSFPYSTTSKITNNEVPSAGQDFEDFTYSNAKLRVEKRLEKSKSKKNDSRDFSNHVNIGDFLGKDTFESYMSIEKLVESIVLKNKLISKIEWEDVCEKYFNSSQLNNLRRLEFSGLMLDPIRMSSLCMKFESKCKLVDLNVSNNALNDIGLIKLLEAITKSSGEKYLLSLNIKQNGITLANEAVGVLSRFKLLRSLDLSCNRISLDISNQKKLFLRILTSLADLQSFSIAYNTIQDSGFELIANVILGTGIGMNSSSSILPRLKKFDVARCNLSGKSLVPLGLLCNSSSSLEDIVIHDNLFTSDQITKIRSMSKTSVDDTARNVCIYFDGDYDGIAQPLRYTVHENGDIV